jgi:hypothetical protein
MNSRRLASRSNLPKSTFRLDAGQRDGGRGYRDDDS